MAADHDWQQKLAARRALRAAGFGTRVNVLLASIADDHASVVPSSYTDIDVLGQAFVADMRPIYTVVYCTTSRVGTDRVLWLRGLRDEFPGATAMLVAREIPRSARELSTRTEVIPFDDAELATFLNSQQRRLSKAAMALEDRLEGGVANYHRALRTLPGGFAQLVAFRDYLHLEFGPARNLQLAIGYLKTPTSQWRASNPDHLALLLEIAQLYAHALVACSRHVLERSLSQPQDGVNEFLGGGGVGIREKRHFAELLVELIATLERDGVSVPGGLRESMQPLPPYTREIAALTSSMLAAPELVERLPYFIESLQMGATLKLKDLAGSFIEAGWSESLVERTFRLCRDILGFLVNQAGLERGFLARFDELLAPPLWRDENGSPPIEPVRSTAAARPSAGR